MAEPWQGVNWWRTSKQTLFKAGDKAGLIVFCGFNLKAAQNHAILGLKRASCRVHLDFAMMLFEGLYQNDADCRLAA
jgi:hypothetical protein